MLLTTFVTKFAEPKQRNWYLYSNHVLILSAFTCVHISMSAHKLNGETQTCSIRRFCILCGSRRPDVVVGLQWLRDGIGMRKGMGCTFEKELVFLRWNNKSSAEKHALWDNNNKDNNPGNHIVQLHKILRGGLVVFFGSGESAFDRPLFSCKDPSEI